MRVRSVGSDRLSKLVRLLIVALTAMSTLAVAVVDVKSQESDSDDETQRPASGQGDSQQKESAQHTNRLANETSPYLLLHAHNPVDWYPWGEEALAKARQENKPIFLSIGYSSCHWCHVMERESFLDQEIAAFLNEHFVCIKVDREERPDIDTIYMTALNIFNQMIKSGRSGGWPLTMFMTPTGKPFFGGTYFPARDGDRAGTPGFLTIAQRVNQAWLKSRDLVKRDAERLAELTSGELSARRDAKPGTIDQSWIEKCLKNLEKRFDAEHGGFNFSNRNPNLPKFPEASNLVFLLDLCLRDPNNQSARRMLETTLDQMYQGGIYDHVGGGFHRYSVDRYWAIPHFEKMLYDNGQLLSIYATATEIFTDKPEYRMVCQEIFVFLKREMTAPGGGFYSALDAESEGEEGKFYRWKKDELATILTEDEFRFYASVYGINDEPNFEERFYAPQLKLDLTSIAGEKSLSVAELMKRLRAINDKLLAARSGRSRPLMDTKILTSWNGLMIRGLADAARILERDDMQQAAVDAGNFVWDNSYVDGRLMRTFTDGKARLNGYLDDYAFLIDGFIALHQATNDKVWLNRAEELQEKQNALFQDDKAGGYFFTSSDHESLLARSRNPSDGATPSGNSVSMSNLVYLADQLDKPGYLDRVKKSLRGTSSLVNEYPALAPRLLLSVYSVQNQ